MDRFRYEDAVAVAREIGEFVTNNPGINFAEIYLSYSACDFSGELFAFPAGTRIGGMNRIEFGYTPYENDPSVMAAHAFASANRILDMPDEDFDEWLAAGAGGFI